MTTNDLISRGHEILDLFKNSDMVENTFGKTLELTKCLNQARDCSDRSAALKLAQRLLDNQSLLFGIPEVHTRNRCIAAAEELVKALS